ncbi:hypothetical protein F4777DRAFT_552425 [Nemania sp. FL0916]|nr:hypothetical protein F4777DRAFT_552425 [Nemania sp. FL0916]
MPLNGRLNSKSIYISLDARPSPGEYHWGLILTGSDGKPALHHASNRIGPWVYEEKEAQPEQSLSLIALLLVAEVNSHSRAKEVIRSIPADGSPSQRTGEAITCRIWVKDVLVALCEQGVIALPAGIGKSMMIL